MNASNVESSETTEAVEIDEVEVCNEAVIEAEQSAPNIVARLVAKDGSESFDLREGTYRIGRRAGANDIVISNPYCSGRHADLAISSDGFAIIDVGSTNGTFVNGVKIDANVKTESYRPASEITFGQAVFRLEVA